MENIVAIEFVFQGECWCLPRRILLGTSDCDTEEGDMVLSVYLIYKANRKPGSRISLICYSILGKEWVSVR